LRILLGRSPAAEQLRELTSLSATAATATARI
jgi:hypothetical protein